MRAAIVDDEPLARSRLRRMLIAQRIDVVKEGANGDEAVQIASDNTVDMIFLDINMPIKNGLQAAKEIDSLVETPPAIIFCTAYDQFAIQAFKTNAVAYLLKPFSDEELVEALKSAGRVSRIQLNQIESQQQENIKLSLKIGNGIELVNLNEISHFHSEDKYVFANLINKEPLFIDKSLKQLESEYSDYFIRTHRNSLVNKKHLLRVFRDESGQALIELADSEVRIEVSRRHYAEVKKCLS